MKKIALVSYHNEPNYGTMLQAYALYKVIKKLGYNAEYISYTTYPFGWLRYWMLFLNVLNHPSIILNRILRKPVKRHEFSFFSTREFNAITEAYNSWYQDNIPHTLITYNHKNIHSIEKHYDVYIVGSDQTWSPYRNSTYPSFYFNFLQFIKDKDKKNAYAPSFGTLSLSDEYCKKIKRELNSFKNVSCRERKNAEFLTKKIGIPVNTVLDPTLLLTPQEWDEVSKPIPMPSKYILCYILGEKECISRFAEKIGEEQGLPVFYILTRPFYLNKKNLLKNVGPGEFLSLIRNASCICTDSFHGTIFSINFNVPFYSFTKRESSDTANDNARIQEVLSDFHLSERFCEDYVCDITTSEVDFSCANNQLERLRVNSNHYISTILND